MGRELSEKEIEALLAENVDADVPLSARTLRDTPDDAEDQLKGKS